MNFNTTACKDCVRVKVSKNLNNNYSNKPSRDLCNKDSYKQF